MQTFLKRVGVPDAVLNIIPEVCSTCQVCREWQRPGNAHQTAVDLPDQFNQQVEGDIMFCWIGVLDGMLQPSCLTRRPNLS